MNTNKVWQLHKWLLSSHAQTRLARPQMRMAQDIADDLSFFEQQLHPFAYVLLLQNWVWSYYAALKIRNNAKIFCQEQTVMTRVAGDIQSSSRWNSGGYWLVLKPLELVISHCSQFVFWHSCSCSCCGFHKFSKLCFQGTTFPQSLGRNIFSARSVVPKLMSQSW